MTWIILSKTQDYGSTPFLRIDRGGFLAWGKRVNEMLGKPDHVDIFVDPVNRRIGVRRATGESFPSKTGYVSLKSALAAKGLRIVHSDALNKSIKKTAQVGPDGVIFIELGDALQAVDVVA